MSEFATVPPHVVPLSSRTAPRRAVLLLTLVFTLAAGPAVAGKEKPLEAKLQRLDGGKVKLSELRRTPVLLELWATWCLPCREQSRIVADLGEAFEERGVEVYALDVGEDAEVVRAFVAETPMSHPVLLDRLQIVPTRLGLNELPALVLLRTDGTVAATSVGLVERTEVLALLDELGDSVEPGAEP